MTEPDGQQIQSALGDVIAQVISDHEHGLVTKWVALIETVAPDGTRGIWTAASPDSKAWDTTGLLTHALHLQQAAIYRGDE